MIVSELVEVEHVDVLVDLIRDIPLLPSPAHALVVKVDDYVADLLGDPVPLDLLLKAIVGEQFRAGLRVLSDPPALAVDQQEDQLVDVVLEPVAVRGHLEEGLDNRQEGVLLVDRIVEFDVQLHRDHITVRLLDEHSHLVVDDVGLPRLVVAVHKLRVLLSDQRRHEGFYAASQQLLLGPAQQKPQRVVRLDDLTEARTVGIHYDEVGQVRVLPIIVIGKVLLVHFIDLQYRLHLAFVELVCHRVIQYVELHYRKLEVHLVVLEDFDSV